MEIPAIRKAKSVFDNADKLYNDILFKYVNLASTQRLIIGLNHLQLENGIKSDGSKIKPFYASLKYKGRRSPVDLYLEGDFYKSFKVSVVKGQDVFLLIWASDFKSPFLKGNYGKEIFGLTDTSVQLFVDNFRPYFLTEIERIIKDSI